MIEAMKQALEALEYGLDYAKDEQFENAQRFKGYEHLAPDDAYSVKLIEDAITTLRQAISEAEKQEPVAWLHTDFYGKLKLSEIWPPQNNAFPVYTNPPKREWVGLTDEEHTNIQKQAAYNQFMSASEFAVRCQVLVEAKLKERNT